MTILRGGPATAVRTLCEVFGATVDSCPDEPAVDTGTELLTYSQLAERAERLAADLVDSGVAAGDRVGLRIKSGTTDLYVAVLGILHVGAAYVPVDVDDPDERARLVFDEAEVTAVVGDGLVVSLRQTPPREPAPPRLPTPHDDAWVIFTSGSTGAPKGVAVTHRSAAAFVDAEARQFLQDEPLGPGDRVMAGLSVAFDASCEEMWLAWAHGGCLVPAPRSLVKTGVDIGPWLVANEVTVVSTVPTLALLWPPEALERVRLLIMGGEACPPEIGSRLARPGRELWNTYGPTEATVVSCGALLTADGPVRIGLPLSGWDLAVVDEQGRLVDPGAPGELVIGGVGLARYLDPAKDAEKFAPVAGLDWDRAYRSGDHVRYDGEGLVFVGRADDQVKLGGRRIELGEVDNALLDLPTVVAAAAAVRRTASGNDLLVGYVAVRDGEEFDQAAALDLLRSRLPAALVPRLAVVDDIPTRTSGKIDRDALPWPVAAAGHTSGRALGPLEERVADVWFEVLGAAVSAPTDDFFDLGGGSLSAAQLVSRLRRDHPELTVADVYEHPTVGSLAQALQRLESPTATVDRKVGPTPLKTQWGQVAATLLLRSITGLRWLTWTLAGSNLLGRFSDASWVVTVSWWWVLAGWVLLITPLGRMSLSVLGARLLLRRVQPGTYPRGGKVHLRIWLAERLADELGATNPAGAAYLTWYARALGADIGRDVDLHSPPPVTGHLSLGDGCSVEPEVDLAGHWTDGDQLHVGSIRIGARARIGTRSVLMPGARIGKDAEIAPGSSVLGEVPAGEFWSGSPAARITAARGPWSTSRPQRRPVWVVAYAAGATLVSWIPILGIAAAAGVVLPAVRNADTLGAAVRSAALWLVPSTLVGLVVVAALCALVVRLAAIGLAPGAHPVHSRNAWQAWLTMRILDEARTWLYPLYASSLTPAWLRLLGAHVGSNVEASTVLLIPALTSINDEAFLADDTLIGSYELGGGYLRIERVKIGKRAFVGNSGMAAPGRKVPRGALVAVLSAVPRRKGVKKDSSWLGSPPVLLRRSRSDLDLERTYAPPRRLRTLRGLVELGRLVPQVVAVALTAAVVVVLAELVGQGRGWLAVVLAGPLLVLGGAVAAGIATGAKWLLVGRHTAREHPLWSSFIWRNEVADAFVEVLAAPWFARPTLGTAVFNAWLRSLGARIGKGVWCDTYWLPEPDLVELRDGATVNRGCVLQTHLFHDRVMSLDTVVLRRGATLGPHSVVLPAASIGRHATVGAVSLVMRGEVVPAKTLWIGNPIGPWVEEPVTE